MSDFFKIYTKSPKKNEVEVYPKFIVNARTKDLMIRGGDFYAVWDEKRGLWSTDEQDVIDMIDKAIDEYADKLSTEAYISRMYMRDADTNVIDKWHKYCQKQMRDNWKPLDEKLTFSNTEVKREDYVSKRLDYPLEPGDISAYEELMQTLYEPDERRKLEWAIGSVVAGDSKHIQKFIVLYGTSGAGKSTVLNIIQELFQGYWASFRSKELTSSNGTFALESFKDNPLVAIEHDSKLDRIEDNTKLNSLVSHETMEVNAKYEKKYSMVFKAFLFMGTNTPVKITEAKSGLLRRLIDVTPSGKRIPYKKYTELMSQIKFELGAIAYHCLEVYNELGEDYYGDYIPRDMMSATNDFYDFVAYNYDDFKNVEYLTLNEAWRRYKEYVDFARIPYPLSMKNVRVELKNYFEKYDDRYWDGEKQIRCVYTGFLKNKFAYEAENPVEEKPTSWLIFDGTVSHLDAVCFDRPAQYAKPDGTPLMPWAKVKTTLSDLDTSELHYLKVPENLIVIDFDIRDKDGNKDFEANLKAASKWPKTYAELSKSGGGIHLHYYYAGDATKLDYIYAPNIEIKVYTGNAALRRKLTRFNSLEIATINSNLPLKGEAKVLNWEGIKSEKMLRSMIKKNLNKEYLGATKPSIDYIYTLLEDARNAGIPYDVTDMRQAVLTFALNSTHQSQYCVKLVDKMKFKSEEPSDNNENYDCDRLVFFDCEVFLNLFLINWKYEDSPSCVRMINPRPEDIETLIKYKLVGFNNRRYDNHILYARMMGYTNEQLYKLSQKIVNGVRDALFGEAYNLSYADVYDFCSKKQSLKKWEIELSEERNRQIANAKKLMSNGMTLEDAAKEVKLDACILKGYLDGTLEVTSHKELALPWDQPVPEERWEEVAAYCDNDVIATEAVFHARKEDFVAREILAELSGMTVNDTTRQHTTKIIFGNEKHPQLVYTDLSETFPGYEFKDGKNMYRGEDASFGGYVYAEPGIHRNVALLDVASLHPHSIIAMNVFGEYTDRFNDILKARIAIKHHDFDTAKNMLDGKLAPYLTNGDQADQLAQALKIVINSVYGYTSATFDNPFKDPRNKNNIVALRGALFMMTLRDEVKARGYKVAHIKTDSIKIPDADNEIIKFCMDFAKKYGYTFEHEATYSRMCLVNDAVYIAAYEKPETCQNMYGYIPGDNAKHYKKHDHPWTATGTQFQIPYVFKELFSKEPIVFDDMCETKSVTSGSLYLDMNESLPEGEHNYRFVGRVGRFCPIKPGCEGGVLYRVKDDKYYAATGTKGYRWLESEQVSHMDYENIIDRSYYEKLCENAKKEIMKYGDFDMFVNNTLPDFMNIPEGWPNDEVPFK